MAFGPQITTQDRDYYSHFVEDEPEAQKLSNLPHSSPEMNYYCSPWAVTLSGQWVPEPWSWAFSGVGKDLILWACAFPDAFNEVNGTSDMSAFELGFSKGQT